MNKLKGVFGLWKLNDRRSAPAQRRARSLFAGALLFAAMFMYVPPAQAHCPVFGPKVYTRPPGKAVVTQNDSFGASILEGTFTLIIDNGTAAGGSRVTRGSIVLNGVEVVKTSEFGQKVARIQKVVQISASNTLAIALRDGAGVGTSEPPFITLQIIRHIEEHDGPAITINHPQPGQTFASSPITVSGTVTDASDITSLTVNGLATPFEGGSFSAQAPLSPGANTITVAATDCEGNTSTKTVAVSLNTGPPQVSINSPADGLLTKVPTVQVSGTVTAAGGVTSVTVNGQPAALNGTAYTAAVALAEGPNTISVVATDNAGQQGTASVSVTLDTTPPTINVLSPRAGQRFPEANITVTGEASDANGVVAVTVNGAPVTLVGNRFERSVTLQLGDNQLTVTATDGAGNVATAAMVVNHFVRLDVSITTPAPQTLFRETAITVTGTADARATSVDVNGVPAVLSGGAFTASAVPLHEGTTVLTATARDGSGSVGTASIAVLRDTSAPALHIDAPTDGATLNTSAVTVTGMVNDVVSGTVNGEQVSVTVNGLPATVANRTFVVPDLLLVRGLNTITAVARDRAGNESQAQIRVNVQDAAGQQHLVLVSGNNQSGVIGSMLPAPLVVQAVDANGNPLPGRTLTFTVRRSDGRVRAGAQEGQVVTVQTDANGQASAQFQLGTRLGVGNNEVSVTAPGFVGELIFCQSSTVGPATEISGAMVMGEAARGQVNSQLPMPQQIIVTDSGGNPVAGVPVVFSIEKGGGHIEGATSVTKLTDSDGKAAVLQTLGPDPGVGNNVLKATVQGLTSDSVFFTASGTAPGAAADTRVSGVVLDNTSNPIPGATAKIVGFDLTAVTDAQGQFVINNAPVGSITLIVDGRTSTRPETFPFLVFHLLNIAGQDNTVGMPIFMPPLDSAGTKTVGGDQDVTLTMKGVPGVAFTVFARSVTDAEGLPYVGPLSLSQVHADKVPMPPPNGTVPKLVWTLQPAGLHFNKPIKVQLPNTDGLAPGQVLEIFSFDHALEQFVSGGMARVSPDGSVIVSDPGFGIHVSGWGTPAPPPPPKKCVGGCDDDNPCTDDSCEDGVCVHRRNIPEGQECHKVEIEAEVIDQDDPNNMTFGPLNGAVYGGSKPNLSDNLKLKAKTDASVGVSNYSWSVQGPGSYPPPGSQEEWNVGEISPTPGMLKFKVVVTFEDGETGEATKEIDSGVRTDDVALIGWIDPDNVPLNPAGMDSEMLRYYPTTGAASMSLVQKGLTGLHLTTLSAAGAAGSDRTIHPVFVRALTAAEKTYILNWMFKFGANYCSRSRCPPMSFASDQEMTTFQTSRRTSYKLFNHFQIKYLTDGSAFKEQPKVLKQAFEIGVTNNPLFDFEEAGEAGPNNGPPKFFSDKAYLINDGTPTRIAVNAFNVLAFPLKWNHIGSRIEFSIGSGTGRRIFTQVYPTYFVFDNLMKTETIPQAPAPIGNFNTSPYPPGPAPFIP